MNLLSAAAKVSSLTMLSRITGLVRETLIARSFGASEWTDAFNVAFRLPNLLRRLFAEGAFSQAFVPILGEISNQGDRNKTQGLVDAIATLLFWALGLTVLMGVIGAPILVFIIAAGLKGGGAYDTTILMTQIMFPYIGLISLVSLSAGILNTFGRFAVPAFTPVLLNLCLIGAAVLLAPAVSVAQISLIINTNIASHLQTGSVSWLSYADRLMEFPTALLGVALGTVLLPSLSKANANQDIAHAGELLVWGLRLTFLLAAPCALALFLFGTPISAVLYHYGQFNALDVEMTRQALAAYGVGLIGLILVKILAPGFYSRQDIRTPVKIALLVLVFTQIANIALVPLFAHAGLALSVGLGACLNAALLWIGLRRKGALPKAAGWLKYITQLSIGLLPLGLLLFYGASAHDWLALQSSPWIRIAFLGLWLMFAALLYFATLWLVGLRWQNFLRHAK